MDSDLFKSWEQTKEKPEEVPTCCEREPHRIHTMFTVSQDDYTDSRRHLLLNRGLFASTVWVQIMKSTVAEVNLLFLPKKASYHANATHNSVSTVKQSPYT